MPDVKVNCLAEIAAFCWRVRRQIDADGFGKFMRFLFSWWQIQLGEWHEPRGKRARGSSQPLMMLLIRITWAGQDGLGARLRLKRATWTLGTSGSAGERRDLLSPGFRHELSEPTHIP